MKLTVLDHPSRSEIMALDVRDNFLVASSLVLEQALTFRKTRIRNFRALLFEMNAMTPFEIFDDSKRIRFVAIKVREENSTT